MGSHGSLIASTAVKSEGIVTSLTISNIDRQLYEALQIAADTRGLSIEDHVCLILSKALEQNKCTDGLGTRIHKRFSIDGGVELDLPSR